MKNCTSCPGFIPHNLDKCPNCSTQAIIKNLKKAATVVGAGMVSMTLMACYGAPPDYYISSDSDPNAQNSENSEPCSGSGNKPHSKDEHSRRTDSVQ
jgi:hypothetical protein